jgi:hypothetical protein
MSKNRNFLETLKREGEEGLRNKGGRGDEKSW